MPQRSTGWRQRKVPGAQGSGLPCDANNERDLERQRNFLTAERCHQSGDGELFFLALKAAKCRQGAIDVDVDSELAVNDLLNYAFFIDHEGNALAW